MAGQSTTTLLWVHWMGRTIPHLFPLFPGDFNRRSTVVVRSRTVSPPA